MKYFTDDLPDTDENKRVIMTMMAEKIEECLKDGLHEISAKEYKRLMAL